MSRYALIAKIVPRFGWRNFARVALYRHKLTTGWWLWRPAFLSKEPFLGFAGSADMDVPSNTNLR